MTTAHTVVNVPSDPDSFAQFESSCASIEADLISVSHGVRKLNDLIATNASPSTVTPHIATIESQVTTLRSSISTLAESNKVAAQSGTTGPSSLAIRVNRFGKLARDFSNTLSRFEDAREKFRGVLDESVRTGVGKLGLNDSEVAEAMTGGKIEGVLEKVSPELRWQVEDVRARNKELEKLNAKVAGLHGLFMELNLLTEAQQGLINEIEENVDGAKNDVEKAEEEIIVARRHQKSARKKMVLIAIILLIIAGIITTILVLHFT